MTTSEDQPGRDVNLRHQKKHRQTEANMAASVYLDHFSTDEYQQSYILERSGVFSGFWGGGKTLIPNNVCFSPRAYHSQQKPDKGRNWTPNRY